jgi:hypothetical protein
MPQWEYCSMSTRAGAISVYFYSEAGAREETISRSGYDINVYAQVLARLGMAGWEMVSEFEGWITFKRPRADGTEVD